MPVPTSYTEEQFKAYLHSVLADTAALLGWTVDGGSYDEVVIDALFACDVTDITELSGAAAMRQLRVLGRLKLWAAVLRAALPEINYTADGATFNREAVFQHAMQMMKEARIDALPYDPDYTVDIAGVSRADDPYNALELVT